MCSRPSQPDTTIEFGDTTLTFADDTIEALLDVSPSDVAAAGTLTVAKNVFLPLTTACRYTCTYCSFFDPPGEASLMSMEEIRDVLQTGADAGCTEALFTFGDTPDDRYTATTSSSRRGGTSRSTTTSIERANWRWRRDSSPTVIRATLRRTRWRRWRRSMRA